jgi:hypothetical protein
MSIGYKSQKSTHAVQGGLLGGHKSAPVRHMLFPPALSSPLINDDLPGQATAGVYFRQPVLPPPSYSIEHRPARRPAWLARGK